MYRTTHQDTPDPTTGATRHALDQRIGRSANHEFQLTLSPDRRAQLIGHEWHFLDCCLLGRRVGGVNVEHAQRSEHERR